MTGRAPHPFPFGPTVALELDGHYRKLQESERVARIRMPFGGDAWLVTGYEDTKFVLSDARFSRAATLTMDLPRQQPEIVRDPSMIMSMDPPRHSRLRLLAGPAFSVRSVDRLRPWIAEQVEGLLDTLAAEGPPADLMAGLALPLPVAVICEILGVPFADRDQFRVWSDIVMAVTAFPPEEVFAAFRSLTEYLHRLAELKRREPADDLFSTLVRATDAEGKLTEQELVTFGITLLVVGHETTVNELADMVFVLLRDGVYAELNRGAGPPLPRVLDELLRFIPLESPGGFARVATEDVEVGGVLIRRGEAVYTQLSAANRDPEVFPDGDALDLEIAREQHLTFGYGPHRCMGALLAKAELELAIAALLRRFPGLELAVAPEEVTWKVARLVRGPETLPVTW
ncbi:cytochrome P450 [Amycolatopsis vastitatis]|uniref:Cytochrome P450 n=1 Tax=Amycolatopsis vastitatis TaxID=1905142 RepID=A0A229T3W0_9PSEU|nr:cytochrome P450 [Amycolatopsis vastitatis]OXM65917.1 cytochrome P450 [Amycolatopsis vastitatis]